MSDNDIINGLRTEVSDLRKEVAKLEGMLKFESDNTTYHIKYIYNYLKMLDDRGLGDLKFHNQHIFTLYDMVKPIEQKIFPGVSEARQQLASIMETLERDSGKDGQKKS